MTIREIANQLYDLSIDGWFDREQFTRSELEQRIRSQFRGEVGFAVPHTMLFEIALPDGWWLFTITHFGDKADEYGYCIPETRDQENKLWRQFVDGVVRKGGKNQ